MTQKQATLAVLARAIRRYRKMLGLAAIVLAFAGAVHAQDDPQPIVITQSSACSQGGYLMWCSGVPMTIGGQATQAAVVLNKNGTGYVSFNGIFAPTTFVTVVSASSHGPTEIKLGFASSADPDKDGDAVSGTLDLTFVYVPQAQGGGRGSHNFIWRPYVSGTGEVEQ